MKKITILFDMDGTLFDTEKWYVKAWMQACRDCGFEMTYEQALTMRSLGRPYSPRHIKEMFGETADYHTIRNRRIEIMKPILAENPIPVKPDVPETLQILKDAGCRLAVATATPQERAGMILTKAGLLDYFEQVVCATMVKEGKPSPDIYLYAAAQMQVDPGEAFAVEDSPNGILSARRAGCKVIMIPDLTQPDESLEPLLYARVNAFRELPGLLL